MLLNNDKLNSNTYMNVKFTIRICISQAEKSVIDGVPSTLKATVIINEVCLIKCAACSLCG